MSIRLSSWKAGSQLFGDWQNFVGVVWRTACALSRAGRRQLTGLLRTQSELSRVRRAWRVRSLSRVCERMDLIELRGLRNIRHLRLNPRPAIKAKVCTEDADRCDHWCELASLMHQRPPVG